MGAMEMTGAEEKMQGEVGTMPRAAPVDDLFAPMGRLDVQSLGVGLGSERGEGGNASLSSSCAISSNVRSRTAEKSPTGGPNLGLDVNHLDISGLSRDYYEGERHDRGGDTNFSPRVNNLEGQSNFTSDDDQVVVDERRQKRMISNRESARRSRLRKQQHLDELRSQIAQLRAENTHMMNRFSLASQQYAQLTEENCVLRSNATDMRHQLQLLHHAASSQQPLSLERGLGTVQPLPLNLSLCSGLTEDANW